MPATYRRQRKRVGDMRRPGLNEVSCSRKAPNCVAPPERRHSHPSRARSSSAPDGIAPTTRSASNSSGSRIRACHSWASNSGSACTMSWRWLSLKRASRATAPSRRSWSRYICRPALTPHQLNDVGEKPHVDSVKPPSSSKPTQTQPHLPASIHFFPLRTDAVRPMKVTRLRLPHN